MDTASSVSTPTPGCFFKEIEALKYGHNHQHRHSTTQTHPDPATLIRSVATFYQQLNSPRASQPQLRPQPEPDAMASDAQTQEPAELATSDEAEYKARVEQLERLVEMELAQSLTLKRSQMEAKNAHAKKVRDLESLLASKDIEIQRLREAVDDSKTRRTSVHSSRDQSSSKAELRRQLQLKLDLMAQIQARLRESGQQHVALVQEVKDTQEQVDCLRVEIQESMILSAELGSQHQLITAANDHLLQQHSVDDLHIQAYQAKIDAFTDLWNRQDQLWQQMICSRDSPSSSPNPSPKSSIGGAGSKMTAASLSYSSPSSSKSRTPVKVLNSPMSIKEYL